MNAQYSCLVVEDSPMMRQLLVFALSRVKNLRVTEADDGVDGLRKLAAGKFDIILTDINMPIMDGLKLVKRVRTDPTHKDVPIIVITTEGSSEDRQRALQLGANAYITKPIQAPQVIAKVKELLKIERRGVGWPRHRAREDLRRDARVGARPIAACVEAGATRSGVNFVASSAAARGRRDRRGRSRARWAGERWWSASWPG